MVERPALSSESILGAPGSYNFKCILSPSKRGSVGLEGASVWEGLRKQGGGELE